MWDRKGVLARLKGRHLQKGFFSMDSDTVILPKADDTIEGTLGGLPFSERNTQSSYLSDDTIQFDIPEGQHPEYVVRSLGQFPVLHGMGDSSGRRSNVRRFAVGLSGILIGEAVTFLAYYQAVSRQDAAVATAPTKEIVATISVTAGDTQNDSTVMLGDAESATKPEPVASGIVDFAKNAPVPIEKRTFLNTASQGGRAFSPVYIRPQHAQGLKAQQTSPGGVKLTQSETDASRYVSSDSSAQWQGGWYANNPQKNIELGKAYDGYLKNNFGEGLSKSLTSVDPSKGSLLKSVRPASHGPTLP